MTRATQAAAVCLLLLGGLWIASGWWERQFATKIWEQVSPRECLRLEVYQPFWVLPWALHSQPHPDPGMPQRPFWRLPGWESPAFYRLYDQRTGELLAETGVYDAAYLGSSDITWGGMVRVGMLEVADVRDHFCIRR